MNKLGFTKVQRFEDFPGQPRAAIPGLIASGLPFSNVVDLAKGRLEEYNSDANDRGVLVGNYFFLPGCPVFSDPSGSGEQKFVFSLDDVPNAKRLVRNLNADSRLNGSYSLPLAGSVQKGINRYTGQRVL